MNPQDDWEDKFAEEVQLDIIPRLSDFVVKSDFLCYRASLLKMRYRLEDEKKINNILESEAFQQGLTTFAKSLIFSMLGE